MSIVTDTIVQLRGQAAAASTAAEHLDRYGVPGGRILVNVVDERRSVTVEEAHALADTLIVVADHLTRLEADQAPRYPAWHASADVDDDSGSWTVYREEYLDEGRTDLLVEGSETRVATFDTEGEAEAVVNALWAHHVATTKGA